MSCITAHDPQLVRLTQAIAQRVGQQRYSVWFSNSTKFDLSNDGLEIQVPNDFISEWIGTHFSRTIQEAAHEVLGCSLEVRFNVVPELFDERDDSSPRTSADATISSRGVNTKPSVHLNAVSGASASLDRTGLNGKTIAFNRSSVAPSAQPTVTVERDIHNAFSSKPRLRHDLHSFITGASNQLAYSTACYVAEFPGAQYNPLFIHGQCGLGKTHLLQGLCRKFIEHHPAKRWMYMTGEEFTNEYLSSLRGNRLDTFRRKMRDMDLLVIDDVHFLGGKRATQEEFLHTFNAIEAMGKQVVMASDNHPKLIEEFGESLINRFVSGMVVRIDPPNFATRCEILRSLSQRAQMNLGEEVINWVARRVTQNIRELEGAITRINAHVQMNNRPADVEMAQQALGDLDRQHVAPVRPENILQSVCLYFGLEQKDLMSGRRQRTISLARSVAMFLIRKTAKLSYPEIGVRMGKRNHSTVISACRRIERAVAGNTPLGWTSSVGDRQEEATEMIQRLEEQSRLMV